MSLTANRVFLLIRNRVKSLSKHIIRNELIRKKLIVDYYRIRAAISNLGKKKPERTAEELLSWRKTLGLKVEFSSESYRGNVLYGVGRCLREYSDRTAPLKACIEHGLYRKGYYDKNELDESGFPLVVTFGSRREECIRALSKKPVRKIGPYILYATPYLDEHEMLRAKEQLGKTLLVFPVHSIEYAKSVFDLEEFIGGIKATARMFGVETILVSLYYRDILQGAVEGYEKAGFEVVTNGYREDSLFIRRQRALIELSDYTMSNGVGTHVGYCIALGKPHFIFEQKHDWDEEEHPITGTPVVDVYEYDPDSISGFFSEPVDEITREQYSVVSEYWGIEEILSEKEMGELFDFCEQELKEDRLGREFPSER